METNRWVSRVSVGLLVASLWACRSEEVLVPEIGAPLCAPDLEREVQLGVLAGELFVPLDGAAPEVLVNNSWNVITAGVALSVRGLPPEDVEVLFSWQVRDALAGEQTFATDLLCDEEGTPQPMPLIISIGPRYGAIADFAEPIEGLLTVSVTARGGDPLACLDGETPDECLVVEQPVQYHWDSHDG